MANDSISFDKTFAPGPPDVGRGDLSRRSSPERSRIPASSETGRSATLTPGDTLGQYRIVRLLGRSGMGEV